MYNTHHTCIYFCISSHRQQSSRSRIFRDTRDSNNPTKSHDSSRHCTSNNFREGSTSCHLPANSKSTSVASIHLHGIIDALFFSSYRWMQIQGKGSQTSRSINRAKKAFQPLCCFETFQFSFSLASNLLLSLGVGTCPFRPFFLVSSAACSKL